jgi:REP-associated tyrosine transposase
VRTNCSSNFHFIFQDRADIIAALPKEAIMPYWRLFYHVVWGTKNRLPLIESVWEADLHGYIWGKATALECIPHAINGMPDHIHVALSIPPKLSVATLIGQLKGASSHRINQKYAGNTFAWQAEYGVVSFSESSLARVVDYVKKQKKHHAEHKLNMAMENFG